MKRTITLISLLSLSGLAVADNITSSQINANTGIVAFCGAVNATTKPVRIAKIEIFRNNGVLVGTGCTNANIQANNTCVIGGFTVIPGAAYFCQIKLTANFDDSDIRGSLEMFDASFRVTNRAELR